MRTIANAPSSPMPSGMPDAGTVGVAGPLAGELLLEGGDDPAGLAVRDDVGPPQLPGDEEQEQHAEGDDHLAGPADEPAQPHDSFTVACSGTIEPL